MSRSERFIGTTYYELLEAYFEKLFETQLTIAERAFMASLLHLCNRARGDEINMSIRMLANQVFMSPSTVQRCLDSLSTKGYLKYTPTSKSCTVSIRELYINRPRFNEKSSATPGFSDTREDKINKDKKETVIVNENFVNGIGVNEKPRPRLSDEETQCRVAEFSASMSETKSKKELELRRLFMQINEFATTQDLRLANEYLQAHNGSVRDLNLPESVIERVRSVFPTIEY